RCMGRWGSARSGDYAARRAACPTAAPVHNGFTPSLRVFSKSDLHSRRSAAMFTPVRFAFAVALAAAAPLASAQDRGPAINDPDRAARVNAAKVQQLQLQNLRVPTPAKAGNAV